MSRANSLKKAVRQIIEHTERVLDEQNAQMAAAQQAASVITTPPPEIRLQSSDEEELGPPRKVVLLCLTVYCGDILFC